MIASSDLLQAMPSLTELRLNRPQLELLHVRPHKCWLQWARATGKSTGGTAVIIVNNAIDMPGSTGMVLADTLTNMETKILPGIVNGFGLMGLVQGKHWVYNTKPPEHWGKPVVTPTSYKYRFSFINGTQVQIMATDTINNQGGNYDWAIVEEAKNHKKEDLDETLLAVRGNDHLWGGLSCHLSIYYISDMPEENNHWLFKIEQQSDEEAAGLCMMISSHISELYFSLSDDSISKIRKRQIVKDIAELEIKLNELRKNLTWVSKASTFDNIETLGIKPIINFRTSLSEAKFDRSVKNLKVIQPENSFYPLIQDETHGYDSRDFEWLNENGYRANSTGLPYEAFREIRTELPLFINFDYNWGFNCASIAQVINKEIKLIKGMHVDGNNKEHLKGLVLNICRYFTNHSNKTIYYFYDHTAKQGKTAAGGEMFKDTVVKTFQSQGWKVIAVYVGHTQGYQHRIDMWREICQGKREYTFSYSIYNTIEVITAVKMTEVKRGKDKDGLDYVFKDKSKEKIKGYPQVEATHYPDSLDGLAEGILQNKWKSGSSGTDIVTG